MRYIQLMQTTRFVVFQLANFFLFFFSGKYLIRLSSYPIICPVFLEKPVLQSGGKKSSIRPNIEQTFIRFRPG